MLTGGEETRTLDLRIANATLSQLSYAPVSENTVYQESGAGTRHAVSASPAKQCEGTCREEQAAGRLWDGIDAVEGLAAFEQATLKKTQAG